jgi:elongation factor 2
MKRIIENLLIEDPNLRFEINEENGEFLLSGMGPLHLEVTAKEIEKRGVKVDISEPRAVFKESCRNESSIIRSAGPNEQNYIELKVARLDEITLEFFKSTNIHDIKRRKELEEALEQETTLKDKERQNLWKCDDDYNLLINEAEMELDEFYESLIEDIIDKIHFNGPLCGEKLTELKITIKELAIARIDEETAFTQLSVLFYDAIKKALNEAELVLLEPIYHTIIQLPPNYVKKALSILSKYSAKIKEIDQDNEYQATIDILLPVRYSVQFAEDLRSTTSGRAFWQNELYAFSEVPKNEADRIISDLKFKKGLSW